MDRLSAISAAAMLVWTGTACAVKQPGLGITDDFAVAWGCDPEDVQEQAARVRDALPSGQNYQPRDDWDACDLSEWPLRD